MWANQYRPKNYEEVVGQEKAVKILKNSVGNATTFILHGPSGVGKTTLARIFADSINGEAIEVNGADNNGVDDVRALISSATYQPVFHDYRVFIIDECHMLTNSAWNALLKILEESPKTTLWMLCTTEPSKIPPTIKSRSTDVCLEVVSKTKLIELLKGILKKEGKTASEEVISDIAVHSNGRVREAIVHLETFVTTGVLSLPMTTIDIIRLLTALYNKDALYVSSAITKLDNEDVYSMIRFLNDYLRLLVLRKKLPQSVKTSEILDTFTSISSFYLDELRVLQDAIWQAVDTNKEQWEGSVHLIYNLYESMMKHYNDFRDTGISVQFAILYELAKV